MLSYKYTDHDNNSLIECPGCGGDLTKPKAIAIYFSINGEHIDFVLSCLKDGVLQDTDDQIVGKGFHSGTQCACCDELLIDFDEAVIEHQFGSL